MEFVEGHEILDTIASMGCYDEADAQQIYRQILEGIAYLHE
jgi:serine/threonine protein kinase